MKTICIGIHVHAEPGRLQATLESVRHHMSPTIDLLVLPDGPDTATERALESLAGIRQLRTATPRGPAACFNRLASHSSADILVLLESGAIVGPRWLDYLLAALEADPYHGLAGPTTNRSWNEQGAFPRAGGSPHEVEHTAQAALQRFGESWRTLEPLHSLADFCYVVRRGVVDAIGAADEGYGLGPCWEMDYNIRAARAGFKGLWAQAAYVWRAPFTARRRHEERKRFAGSRQRYQDKFCGLRLNGQRQDYKPHCRGDACEHFAPVSRIQFHLLLSEPIQPDPGPTSSASQSPVQAPRPSPHVPRSTPIVSCIMPTGNRTEYVLQSICYLQRQDFSHWELIIVDDGDDGLAARLPQDKRIRYHRVRAGLSIGAKRNHACSLARGDVIAQWDDDDWYGLRRLSAQVAPLLTGQADITGLNETTFFELDRWLFWRCSPQLHQRLFVEDVHGGTLVYRRQVWQRLAQYPDYSLAEDARFLRIALRRGARLQRLSGRGHFIYLRHGTNAWNFACGHYMDARGWQPVADPGLPSEDRVFYAARSTASPSVQPAPSGSRSAAADPLRAQPARLVSCIMPTANRRPFVTQALHYFLRQDYEACELIVVDDGEDSVADLVPPNPRIRYIRLPHRRTVGAKRNLACREARGDIIVHWDDDDWMSPWRLSYQVSSLVVSDAQVAGLNRVLYYDPWERQGWQYTYPPGEKPWVSGNTLCYYKDTWWSNPFPEINVGEDTRFVWSNADRRVLPLDDSTFFVAMIHAGNVSPKRPAGERWEPLPPSRIEELLGDDGLFYARLRQSPLAR